ncbi:MAG: fused MFS/spermidine synthase [Planctomycetota bacterium]|nr:fused MFS/spermidine synthase [Planctomycetota bacterium]
MLRFALTIFTSAFLLFQVQPLIARFILPWFGGTPAVWSTCMLFFQLILLAGYSYAHVLNHFFDVRRQAMVHLGVLLAACLMLPIIPNDSLRPSGDESPVLQILLVLGMTIGLPYFVVSTTGPLLQSWFAKSYPGRSPYRLFALSNFGSLVALLTYPFVFEPYLRQKVQAYSWSGGFIVFALFCGWCALRMMSGKQETSEEDGVKESNPEEVEKYSNLAKPDALLIALWIGLSMVPSILLLATTNQVCQEIAVVPFLWVLPLALYLVTFIICFEAPYLYVRAIFYPLFALSILAAVVCLHMGVEAPMWIQAGGLISAFFFGSMVCHGELACNKPAAHNLTLYYLAVSIGGALGGVFVVLAAPLLFNAYFELHVGLVLAVCLTAIAFHVRTENRFFRYVPYVVSCALSGVIAIGLSSPIIHHAYTAAAEDGEDEDTSVLYKVRDFWGILTVKHTVYSDVDENGKEDQTVKRQLLNGRINHGMQFVNKKWQRYKTTYYCPGSGVGFAVERNPRRTNDDTGDDDLRMAVIGLGTGTMAAWGESGDTVRFYEINPEVKKVAEEYFSYMKNAQEDGVEVDVVLGDARIQMQRQAEAGDFQKFDIIAVDAFSSDAIPRHLLTKECVQLYEQHLRDPEQGIIAIHISNRFLDLEGICHRIGTELGYEPILIECSEDDDKFWRYSNTWVLFSKSRQFIEDAEIVVSRHDWENQWRQDYVVDMVEEATEGTVKRIGESAEAFAERLESMDYSSIAEQYAQRGKERLEELVAERELAEAVLGKEPRNQDLKEAAATARNDLEGFIREEAGIRLELDESEDIDMQKIVPELLEKRKQYVAETREKYQKALKQFDVLWTDDFGSLWQVIRMEFDWEENRKELAEWWKEWNESEEESSD